MKSAGTAAILLVFMIAVVPLIPSPALSQPAYSEKLSVYLAGSNALWFLRFDGLNISSPALSAAESVPGLSWYNVTAISTTSWSSDFQVFGPNGYNLIPVPSITAEGVFLSVGASSFNSASSVASALDPLFLSAFSSYSNGTGAYVFYSPVSFSQAVTPTLMKFYPYHAGGFASLISPKDLSSLSSPLVILSATKGQSGFVHSLVVSSIKAGALDSTHRPTLLTLFGSGKPYIRASNMSSSSTIIIHALDGLISSPDSAKVSNDRRLFTGTYSLTLTPGQKVYSVNATVLQQPVLVVAYRQFDSGVLKPGGRVSVTVSARDITNGTTAANFTLSDDWWKSYSFFKLVNGSSDIRIHSLPAQQTESSTYVLQYSGNVSEQVSIPASTAVYTYAYGQVTYSGSATLNGGLLYLGIDEPSVYAFLSPSGGSGNPIGMTQYLTATVKNVGTRTALGVVVGGRQVGSLLADGGSSTVSIPVRASSLVNGNVTESVVVRYGTPEGQTVSVVSNPVTLLFSHTSMEVGLASLLLNGTLSYPKQGETNLTLTFTASARGGAAVTDFSASAQLPSWLGCGRLVGKNGTCSGDTITLRLQKLRPGSSQTLSVLYNVTQPRNVLLHPIQFAFSSSGFNMTGYSNGYASPAGVRLLKTYSPNPLFGGMKSSVSVSALNQGPYPLYNATVAGGSDTFDSLAASSAPSQASNRTVQEGGNFSFSYSVIMGQAAGSFTPAPVSASFFFGGQRFSLSQPQGKVALLQPLSATITSFPKTPVENRPFSIIVTIHNPASVAVSGVNFYLPLPPGVSVVTASRASYSNGRISISIQSMPPNSTYTANITAVASSGISIPFSGSGLTFTYAGSVIKGTLPSTGIVINEDITTRYLIPITLVLLGALATALYVRRRVGTTTSPSSRR